MYISSNSTIKKEIKFTKYKKRNNNQNHKTLNHSKSNLYILSKINKNIPNNNNETKNKYNKNKFQKQEINEKTIKDSKTNIINNNIYNNKINFEKDKDNKNKKNININEDNKYDDMNENYEITNSFSSINIFKNSILSLEEYKVDESIIKEDKNNNSLYNSDLLNYMNSLLQSLYYISELRNYFVKNAFSISYQQQPICKEFAKLMIELKHNKDIKQDEFSKILTGKNILKNSLLKIDRKNNSSSLFINLMHTLLKEMSKNDKYDDIISFNEPNRNNKMEMFRDEEKKVDKNNIINKLFLGYYEKIYNCKKNSDDTNKSYNFMAKLYIVFDLEKIQNYYKTNDLSIKQCFDYNYKYNIKKEFNYCNKCKVIEKSTIENKIYILPTILVLILYKEKNKNYDWIVVPDENLDLSEYMDEEKYNNNYKYKLISISYEYSSLNMTDNGDYYFNRDKGEFNKELIQKEEPFLLFYRRDI